MATPVSQNILTWLQNVLSNNYRDFNRSYSDIANALHRYPSLKLRNDVYTSENGATSLLVNVHGVLPVTFRGSPYGFPVSLWIPQEYPWSAPMIFVVATQDMVVRPGQHTSAEGRIYHPYLASWQNDRSNITELLSILQDVFSKVPPLVSKQQQVASQRPQPQQDGFSDPSLHRPPIQQSYSHQPPSTPSQPPLPPPKPPKGDGPAASKYERPAPLPQEARGSPQASRSQTISNTERYPINQDPRRPPPTHGHIQSGSHPPPTGWQQYQAQAGPFSPSQGQPTSPHAYQSPPPNVQQHYQSQQPPQPSAHPQQVNHPSSAGPPAHQFAASQPLHQNLPQHMSPHQSQPRRKPPEDLLTSPFDAAMPIAPPNVAPPPIPPNPEKDALLAALSKTLTQQIQSTHASTLSAIPPLRAQQAALTSTLNAINKETSQLKDLEAMLTSNEQILHKAMHDADKVLEDAKRRKVPDVDEVLVAPTVVAGQLYQVVAEARAIEDCRAVLGKALDRGRISSSVWAKQTRSLAREEFLKKSLIKKISKGMGLVEEREWQ